MISITESFIEQNFKQLLQHKVSLSFGEKVWREGQLILFKQDGFFIELILKKDNRKRERFEIPIPFNIFQENSETYVLSYRLDELAHQDLNTMELLKSVSQGTRSKFLDTNLYIHIQKTGPTNEV